MNHTVLILGLRPSGHQVITIVNGELIEGLFYFDTDCELEIIDKACDMANLYNAPIVTHLGDLELSAKAAEKLGQKKVVQMVDINDKSVIIRRKEICL
jgi:hypothetical protein